MGCLNQALLAKQAWRLISNPQSLVAKVLMGKYCGGKDFLESKAKSGCSWGWRSIMWGLELLRDKIAWRLGDGETITVFGHQWIPESCNPFVGTREKPIGS